VDALLHRGWIVKRALGMSGALAMLSTACAPAASWHPPVGARWHPPVAACETDVFVDESAPLATPLRAFVMYRGGRLAARALGRLPSRTDWHYERTVAPYAVLLGACAADRVGAVELAYAGWVGDELLAWTPCHMVPIAHRTSDGTLVRESPDGGARVVFRRLAPGEPLPGALRELTTDDVLRALVAADPHATMRCAADLDPRD
jgi:hypothetical protein